MDDKGIDKEGIEKQIASIEYYIAEIKEELNSITRNIRTIKSCYMGQGADSIISRYNDTNSRYSTMFTKIETLKNQLSERITDYHLEDQRIASDVLHE